MRVLVSAGGTGGGVYPALAVAECFGARAELLWVGGKGGMEESLVQREGIPFKAIPAAGVHGVGLRNLPGNLSALLAGFREARKVVDEFRPDVVFTTGGYLSVPVALASGGVPIGCFVPDIEPGLALRFVSRRADVIALTTEESRQFYREPDRVRVTGYPVREIMRPIPKDQAVQEFDLDPTKAVLLVFGGSRGARSINEALWDNLPTLLLQCQILHITGSLDWPRIESVQSRLSEEAAQNYRPYPYLHSEMGRAMSAADLVLSRAGAATLGEFPHFGLPSILVPYPHAWRYQRTNASYLVERGAAVVVNDEDLKIQLLSLVTNLLDDSGRLAEMSRAAQALRRPEAAGKIAQELERIARKEAEFD